MIFKNRGELTMLSKKYAVIDKDICVACGACTKECPKSAISVFRGCYAVIDKQVCIGCGRCAGICPAGCILLVLREEKKYEK
jgi:ferredoxin